MSRLAAKVSYDELAKFLAQHGKYWTVGDCPQSFTECLPHDPVDVDGLIAAIDSYCSHDYHHVFVFNLNEADSTEHAIRDTLGPDAFEPEGELREGALERIPEVSANELDTFIVRCVRGTDFLYFSSGVDPWREMTILLRDAE